MRKAVLLVLIGMLVASAAAEQRVQHSIETDRDEAQINSTIRLECSGDNCPVNSWKLAWSKPSEAEVVKIKDSLGEINDYEVTRNEIEIETNSGSRRRSETVKIVLNMGEDASEIHDGLYKREFRLPGFEGVETEGRVKSKNLLSGRVGYGYESSFSNSSMTFRGSGPVNVRIKFGDGYKTRYFKFFGAEYDDQEQAYEIPMGVIGQIQNFDRFPVAVMDDTTYNEKVNDWSAGEYFSGAIQIRSKDSIRQEFSAVLAHEVVHGINDRMLSWDQTSSTYFDEGTAKYVEFLVSKKMYSSEETDRPPRELFGEDVTYDNDTSDRQYYSLPSKGDREDLWEYYSSGGTGMKRWSAFKADPEMRGFGYAYSELVIRNYVAHQNGSLKQLYMDLDPRRKLNDPEQKWDYLSGKMDMTPCKYESRKRFRNCLESINSYDYPVYSAEPDRNRKEIRIGRLEIPDRKQTQNTVTNTDFNTVLDDLRSLFDSVFSWLASLV